jgi:YD repeat-containing protein
MAGLGLALLAPPIAAEDEMRDFYAEPGLNPFRSSMGQDVTEHIDPFSGSVQLSYVDLSIPGDGGLDLNITRYYNLPQGSPGYANPFGYGWTMHFGRITIGSGHASQLCDSAAVPGGDTRNNPSMEMPSGGRELLVRSSAVDDGSYITRSNWRARCIDPGDYRKGLVATSPDGTSYYLREYVFMQGEDGPAGEPAPQVETWLTNRIVDVHGNSVDVSYLEIASGMKLAVEVVTSDGRVVTLDYVDSSGSAVTAGSVNARLSRISANGHSWRYHYAPVDEVRTGWGFIDHYLLVAVERPDGSRWEYGYGEDPADPGYRRLTQLRYPSGGIVDYSYQRVWPYLPRQDFYITAIQHKSQTNPGRAVGSWSWEFHPGAVDMVDLGVEPVAENAGRMADFTRVITPVGQEHVFHVGYWALVDTHDLLWQMGLKLKHQHLSVEGGSGELRVVRSLSNAWSPRDISGEVYRGGILSALWDSKTYAPVLSRQSVLLDGYRYRTDFLGHDAFGNPGSVIQGSLYDSENGDRVTNYSYRNDVDRWLIGLPEIEATSEDGTLLGTVTRIYDDKGLLSSEKRFGVETRYGYTAPGNLETVTDTLGNITRYSDHFRGIARLEQYPDGSTRRRVVNPEGTVAARVSGRGHTTAFTYDGLNRLTGIDYPLGSDVSIAWGTGNKVLTRGAYRERIEWDGFGRETRKVRSDLSSGVSYATEFAYDELGRRIFESDVNTTQGITRHLDVVGRTLRVVNQDGSDRVVTHEGAHRELHRDENGNVTEYLYQVYGSPEERQLIWVVAPEGVATRIQRDVLGNVRSVFQGELDPANPQQYLGYLQNYSYNQRLQLTGIDSPADLGLTLYGRDTIGNMVSRQVGTGPQVFYSYDAMNRPESVDYPDDSIDVNYSYDQDGRLASVLNSYGERSYRYDANGNLSAEDILIGEAGYALTYAYDQLDHLTSMDYPSGRSVDYAPDALGKPSQALPYLNEVAYHANGSLQRMVYANGRSAQFTRTDRNQVDRLAVDSLVDLDYNYDPAGNVLSILDAAYPGNARSMNYDGLHRLTSVTAPWGITSYLYDVYGNLTRKDDPARDNREQYYQYQGLLLDRVVYSDSAAQRIFTYDDHGNVSYSDDVIFDVISGLPLQVRTRRQHSFDDAGNLRFSSRSSVNPLGEALPLGSGSFSSEYDGANNRIRKINHSNDNQHTDYLYSRAGLLMGEYDVSGAEYGNEYFYLGDRQIATAKYNSPPQVDTGSELQAAAGSRVQLDASARDLDGRVVAHEWMQLSGPEVHIDNPTVATTFFDTPVAAGGSTIVLQHNVTDDRGAVASSTLTVEILTNQPPRANAGVDRDAMANASLSLDGSGSSDAEGPLGYRWSGEHLAEADTVSPLISPPELGRDYSLTYTLTVTDSDGLQDSDEIVVRVLTLTTDQDADRLADGWEIFHFGDIANEGPGGDADGDGLDHRREFLDGTDPREADSAAPVAQVTALPGDGSSMLVWQRPVAAGGYRVYWTQDAAQPLSAWEQVLVDQDFYVHPGLENGVDYHYAIGAYNALGEAQVSQVVSATPGERAWHTRSLPSELALEGKGATSAAFNRVGGSVVVSETLEGDVYRLDAWQYSLTGGWRGPEQVSRSMAAHLSPMATIDDEGNLLVAWINDESGVRDLYASYRPRGEAFRSPVPIEHYQGDGQVSGDVIALEHLEFSAGGSAWACWRQHRAHWYGDHLDPGVASALVNRFDPITGWGDERSLEMDNNIGDTLRLSCDVSRDGRVAVAWQRHNSFNSDDPIAATRDHDVWVATYDPQSGWQGSETVEFIQYGIREMDGLGIHNHAPQAAVAVNAAAVLWYNSSDSRIDSLSYDYGTGSWQELEVLESRSRRIPGGDTHRIVGNANGTLLASWGTRFVTWHSGDTGWSREKSLPAVPDLLGIDGSDRPYLAYVEASDVIAARFDGKNWVPQLLSLAGDLSDKRLINAQDSVFDDLGVYWTGSTSLHLSAHQSGEPPTGDDVPVTTFSLESRKVKGANRYTITLASDRAGSTYFRFAGQGVILSGGESSTEWQIYGQPVVIQMDKSGTGQFEFYSEDSEGNRELTRTEVLQ